MWPSIRHDASKSFVIWALRNSFRDNTPVSVLQLAALANESLSSPDLRAAAVVALKAIHTQESLPFLASLLSSSDVSERVNAVIGLSSFANGCPMQTPQNVASMDYIQFKNPSPYRTAQTEAAFAFGPLDNERESELVAFWTDWWNQNKVAILKMSSRQ
jgi:HEAT repeat protein